MFSNAFFRNLGCTCTNIFFFAVLLLQVNDGSAVSNIQAVVGSDVEGYDKVHACPYVKPSKVEDTLSVTLRMLIKM